MAGLSPVRIVLEVCMTTVSPVGELATSLRQRVWGPDQSEVVGDSRLEALRKAKYPSVRAALTGRAW